MYRFSSYCFGTLYTVSVLLIPSPYPLYSMHHTINKSDLNKRAEKNLLLINYVSFQYFC